MEDPILEAALIASFKEAVTITEIAAQVLDVDSQNFEQDLDPRVKSMVTYVLGPSNGLRFREHFDIAKVGPYVLHPHWLPLLRIPSIVTDSTNESKATSGTCQDTTKRKPANSTPLAI